MNFPSLEMFAAIKYDFSGISFMTEWWHWLVLLAVCIIVVIYIVYAYYRDMVELRRPLGIAMLILRVAAFAGILLAFLGVERLYEHRIVQNSRILMLIDTSQSMSLQDADEQGKAVETVDGGKPRIDYVVKAISEDKLVSNFRKKHDVVVFNFDQQEDPREIASLPKILSGEEIAAAQSSVKGEMTEEARRSAMTWLIFGIVLCGLALLMALVHTNIRILFPEGLASAWTVLVAVCLLIPGVVCIGVADLSNPGMGVLGMLGWVEPEEETPADDETTPSTEEVAADPKHAEFLDEDEIDWRALLAPHGNETRIGDALVRLISRERGKPVAGILLFSDGRSNAGVSYEEAVTVAQDAHIPIHVVGLGADTQLANLRVVDVEAPQRAFPGDDFPVSGVLQAYGMEGNSVDVQLISTLRSDDPTEEETDDEADEKTEEIRTIVLGEDGEMIPVRFETAAEEAGRRRYTIRVTAADKAGPPEKDHNPKDNENSATVDVVMRKNRVLLFAGGPTREYRFLRNQLFRDKETTVDVLLQTAEKGIAQEADEILDEFPSTEDELFGTGDDSTDAEKRGYDCIVAFDPDWRKLSEEQVKLLERWIAEKGGGLIVVAGPVYTPEWASRRIDLTGEDSKLTIIKNLYPVMFFSRGTATGLDKFGSTTPNRLSFSREGQAARYLFLGSDDDPVVSRAAWDEFEGVYGYYTVKGPKPGASVLARFVAEEDEDDEDAPIYFASHYYGAGRVFFAASGEMWRIRRHDHAWFEQFYTKLIRYIAEGRLLRDSSRGVLLTGESRYFVGDSVTVRAHLTDSQHKDLTLPEVEANLVLPDKTRSVLKLKRVEASGREGDYTVMFTVTTPGVYRIELPVPESDDEYLTREITVRIPDREIERPKRDDTVLQALANSVDGGTFEPNTLKVASLPDSILSQQRPVPLPDEQDRDFQMRLLVWLMGCICGALFLEWILRRLNKLA